jgi:hypothetical protein
VRKMCSTDVVRERVTVPARVRDRSRRIGAAQNEKRRDRGRTIIQGEPGTGVRALAGLVREAGGSSGPRCLGGGRKRALSRTSFLHAAAAAARRRMQQGPRTGSETQPAA